MKKLNSMTLIRDLRMPSNVRLLKITSLKSFMEKSRTIINSHKIFFKKQKTKSLKLLRKQENLSILIKCH